LRLHAGFTAGRVSTAMGMARLGTRPMPDGSLRISGHPIEPLTHAVHRSPSCPRPLRSHSRFDRDSVPARPSPSRLPGETQEAVRMFAPITRILGIAPAAARDNARAAGMGTGWSGRMDRAQVGQPFQRVRQESQRAGVEEEAALKVYSHHRVLGTGVARRLLLSWRSVPGTGRTPPATWDLSPYLEMAAGVVFRLHIPQTTNASPGRLERPPFPYLFTNRLIDNRQDSRSSGRHSRLAVTHWWTCIPRHGSWAKLRYRASRSRTRPGTSPFLLAAKAEPLEGLAPHVPSRPSLGPESGHSTIDRRVGARPAGRGERAATRPRRAVSDGSR